MTDLINRLNIPTNPNAEETTIQAWQIELMAEAAKVIADQAAEIERLRAQCQHAQAQANALDRGFLSVWRDGEAYGKHAARKGSE